MNLIDPDDGVDRREVLQALNRISSRLSAIERHLDDLRTLILVIAVAGAAALLAIRGPSWVTSALIIVAFGLPVLSLVKYWLDGWRGRGQWPSPHGRYYNQWFSLSSKTAGDYYPWLAAKMGNREPWRTWAERERE